MNSNKKNSKYIDFIKSLLHNFLIQDFGIAISEWILSDDDKNADIFNKKVLNEFFSRFFYHINKIFSIPFFHIVQAMIA